MLTREYSRSPGKLMEARWDLVAYTNWIAQVLLAAKHILQKVRRQGL
jgi:hypothetical protein